MSRWIYIILITGIFACSRNEQNVVVTADSTETHNMSQLLDTIRYLMVIKTSNVTYQKKIIEQSKLIDTYQLIIKTQQLDEIDLQDLKIKIYKLRDSNLVLINKIIELNKENINIKDSNILAKQVIKSVCAENIQLHKVVNVKHEVHNPFLSDIKIKACGFTKDGVFTSASIFQTDIAKQVRRIEIRYLVYPNPKDEDKKHVIKTYITQDKKTKGEIRSSTYRQENPLQVLESIDYNTILEPDTYFIKITIDDEQTFQSILPLK